MVEINGKLGMPQVITRVREKESQVKLLELLTRSQPVCRLILSLAGRAKNSTVPQRRLELWSPAGCQPRYRISLFSGRFFFRIPGILPDPDSETYDGSHSVFVSISISPTFPHPCSARRWKRKGPSPLNSIGIRVSGKHPITTESFDVWAAVGDGILRRILEIASSFEDQALFWEVCTRSFEMQDGIR